MTLAAGFRAFFSRVPSIDELSFHQHPHGKEFCGLDDCVRPLPDVSCGPCRRLNRFAVDSTRCRSPAPDPNARRGLMGHIQEGFTFCVPRLLSP